MEVTVGFVMQCTLVLLVKEQHMVYIAKTSVKYLETEGVFG